jgi:predicted DNA-binding transcriptional regulator AlpA
MTNSKQLLRISEVSKFTSLAKSTINLWVALGKFPKPILLSPTIKVWRLEQLHDWIDGHTNETGGAKSLLAESPK